ncbi:MAG: alpha/beta hydrolase fold domain-containing protein [Chitinivibrionales bacterium]|nr:alpha/beta hydrolase fold domain-containing protein [Chitinivibrionales bacterium]
MVRPQPLERRLTSPPPHSDISGRSLFTSIRSGQSTKETAAMAPSSLRSPEIRIIADIPYREVDKEYWRLDLALPASPVSSPVPLIVVVHGGGWCACDKTSGMEQEFIRKYAHRGIACASVEYRLSQVAPFPAAVEDVKCAVRFLRAHAEKFGLDPNRFGAQGHSAGGHLVAMLGLVPPDAGLEGDGPYQEQSSMVQAVAPMSGVFDLTAHIEQRNDSAVHGFLAGPEETLLERAGKASPVSYVTAGAPPFLVIHGTNDDVVDVQQAVEFVQTMSAAGAKADYKPIEDGDHGMYQMHRESIDVTLTAFFERTLEVTS